jgi:hypothetical protein
LFDVQRTSEKSILNDLGREKREAVAYLVQSNTVLLKDRRSITPIENRSGGAADHVECDIARDTVALQKSGMGRVSRSKALKFFYALLG